ncbi:phosphatase PAP2 family protein [Adlercreutzia murintestinalis]|uniref:phosphatase PAP2 family protein n=1 Tax=Adlercreutzia murintestinalis TaxID=2941325 RepID=UPI00203DB4F5|nr:phosphatase PAP2 family protein [Adlercreutzia murintestinalis]
MMLLDALQATLRAPWLDGIMVPITLLGNLGAVWLVLGVVLACLPKQRRVGVAVIVAVVAAGVIGKLIIGEVVMRPRPCDVNPSMHLLIARPFGSSFPSGHTAAACAAVAVLVAERMPRGLTIPCAVLAVLIAVSRLYLYVHYPTDVLAGAVLGIAVGVGTAKLIDAL